MQNEWILIGLASGLLIPFSAVLSTSLDSKSTVTSEAVENGSFVSYNKKDAPLDLRVTLGVKGEAYTQDFILCGLEELRRSPAMVGFSTPWGYHDKLTLADYKFERKPESGSHLLIVTLHLVEVREFSSSLGVKLSSAQVKNPTSASKTDVGRVQAQNPGTAALPLQRR